MKKYLSRYFKFLAIVLMFLIFVETSFALVISEIQYDPAGSDTDREWLEIFNDGNAEIDLTSIKFFENNTNHGIDILSGDKNLLSGEYAILVQDINKFKLDYPAFTGKIFKSSFSLLNSGEILSLKDKDGNILNTLNYGAQASSAGNGFTLNLSVSEGTTTFVKMSPTPGTGNLPLGISPQIISAVVGASTDPIASTTTEAVDYVPPTYYNRSYWPESEKIYIEAGINKIGISGAPLNFEARAINGDKKPISNANFFWSFGDGESGEGKKIFHAFKYNGEYVVDIEAFANGQKNNHKIYVKIIDPEIKIKIKKLKAPAIEISNNTKEEVDIGGFIIKTKGGSFESTSNITKHLTILPKKTILISQETLKFATDTNQVSLHYANENLLDEFILPEGKVLEEKFSTSTVLSVMTKTDYDKINNEVSIKNLPQNSPNRAKAKITYLPKKELIVKNDTPTSVVKEKQEINDNKFIIKEEDNFLSNMWKYFGI